MLTRSGVAATLAALLVLGCRGTLPGGWLYVTRVDRRGATVVWTGTGTEPFECHGGDGRLLDVRPAPPDHGLVVARLDGLLPGTRYACRLGGAGRRRTVLFRTAPDGVASFRFAVVGDSGDGSPQAAALARRILASRPAFLLHLGDLAYDDGSARRLDRRFFHPYGALLARTPFFPTPGNHDLHSSSAFFQVFGPAGPTRAHPHYAFEWGGTRFVALASRRLSDGDGPHWLADTLADARADQWRVVFLHEPPLMLGGKSVSRGLRDTVEPLLEAGKADLVLAGHVHLYARAEPACAYVAGASVLEMISGGGGRNLDPAVAAPNFPRVESRTHFLRVDVTPAAIDVRAVDLAGHVVEHVRLRRGAAVACRSGGWPVAREKKR